MPLHLIGMGLGDTEDITLRGLKLLKGSKHVYLESYTSIYPALGKEEIRAAYDLQGEIISADRNLVESGCDEMLAQAQTEEVSFLVIGDPLCATTHTDLFLRCKERGVAVDVVHNASWGRKGRLMVFCF